MAEKEMRGTSPRRIAGRAAFGLMLCLLAIGFMSCGTMAGNGKPQVVTFTSPQPGVEFEIYNGAGKHVFSGKTPTQVSLKASKWTVSERYYVKSGGRVEVFQGDFSLGAYVKDVFFTFELGLLIDMKNSAQHSLQEEQELGSVYLNKTARLFGTTGGK
jgi:hypothetical protein